MRILFFLPKKTSRKDYTAEFTQHLYSFLKKKHIVTTTKNGSAKWNLWDLILVQDGHSLVQLKKKLKKSDVPVIFFSHNNSWQFPPFVFRNLIKVFSFNYSSMSFINPEIVQFIPRPIFAEKKNLKVENKDSTKINVLYYYEDNEINSRVLPSIIHFANINHKDMRLTILMNRNYINIAKCWVNSTISIKEISAFPGELNSGYDLVYGSGVRCLVSLLLGIPTVVVGVRGYGGLVDSENIEEHLKSNFQGRIGGEIAEEIPYWILSDQFSGFISSKDEIRKSALFLAGLVAKSCHPKTIFLQIENELYHLNRLVKKIKTNGVLSLQPKVMSGIYIAKSLTDGIYDIVNRGGLIVGNISQDEKIIIEKCNGANTVSALGKATGHKSEIIRKFILELWHNKVIYFDSAN
jgi:hypothetical protein